jgi:hypothetical protein
MRRTNATVLGVLRLCYAQDDNVTEYCALDDHLTECAANAGITKGSVNRNRAKTEDSDNNIRRRSAEKKSRTRYRLDCLTWVSLAKF